jgi:ketosteroid isomerase-like protein
MRRLPFLALLLFVCSSVRAQHTPQATITAIFDHMKAGDTTGLRAYFHPDATLHSVVTKPDGKTDIAAGSIDKWFVGMQKAEAGDWEETLHYTEVNIDGHLASAWTPYAFNFKGELHHCGVNAFQLVKDGEDGQWRILHISDTRRDAEGDCIPVAEQSPHDAIDELATNWHKAAANADSTTFFDALMDDAIYIGTDKAEHWTKAEFLGFAAPYFARGKAWDFNAVERHVFYDPNQQVAYWDEVLDTWMGPCRGTAVVMRDGVNGWKIAHYTLSMTVPNDKVEEVMKATGEKTKER